jgi:hypothetical protein
MSCTCQLERQVSNGPSSATGRKSHRETKHVLAPDRGLSRAFLGRATYNIDTNRSLAWEAVVRQSGDGLWLKSEYSQAWDSIWWDCRFTLIRGDPNDFLGQYRQNS